MELRTIVVGVDFSPMSELACRQAAALAHHTGARLVLAHATALPEPPEGLPASMQATADAYLGILRGRAEEAQHDLAALAERLSTQGAEISQILVDGFADEALLHAADELKADLIVTGSHGRRGVSRLLLGSVAERVVRGATCPVLVARGEVTAFRRIVVATDFSPAAERGLELALALAADGATIDLLHFWDAPALPRAHATSEVDATVDEIRGGMIEHGTARGAAVVAAHPNAAVRYHLQEGDAVEGITAWATTQTCDLIAIGSHGHRGLRRLLLGSVAEATVRHAPCSVLVAH